MLDELEQFDRVLVVKRTISANDLTFMSKVEFLEGPRYIPAMLKTLLSAPQNFVVDGTANMFTGTDYANIHHERGEVEEKRYLSARAHGERT